MPRKNVFDRNGLRVAVTFVALIFASSVGRVGHASDELRDGKSYVIQRVDGATFVVTVVSRDVGSVTVEDSSGRQFAILNSEIASATPFTARPSHVPSRQFASVGISTGEYFGFPDRGIGIRVLAVSPFRAGLDLFVHEGVSFRISGGRVFPILPRRGVSGLSSDITLYAGYHDLILSDRMSHGANVAAEWSAFGWSSPHFGLSISLRTGADFWAVRAPRYPPGQTPIDASNRRIPLVSPDLRAAVSLVW